MFLSPGSRARARNLPTSPRNVSPVPANGNLTFSVAVGGSDSNPGTAAAPFATIQHALNVAASYDYQFAYFPTISIGPGTFNPPAAAKIFLVPELIRPVQRGLIKGAGTASTFLTNANFNNPLFQGQGLFCQWGFEGFKADVQGPVFYATLGASFTLDPDNVGLIVDDSAASGKFALLEVDFSSVVIFNGGSITILPTTMFALLMVTGGEAHFQSGTLTYPVNDVTATFGYAFAQSEQVGAKLRFNGPNITQVNSSSFRNNARINFGNNGLSQVLTADGSLNAIPGDFNSDSYDPTVQIGDIGNAAYNGTFIFQNNGRPSTANLVATDVSGVFLDFNTNAVYSVCRLSSVSTNLSPVPNVDLRLSNTANQTLDFTLSGYHLDNAGSAGEVDWSLPVPVRGFRYDFCNLTTNAVKVRANSSTLVFIGTSSAQSIGGGYVSITNSTTNQAAYIGIEAVSTTRWVTRYMTGAWVVSTGSTA